MNWSLTHVVDYIIEKEPLVNKFISVPKDKGLYTSNKLTAFMVLHILWLLSQ